MRWFAGMLLLLALCRLVAARELPPELAGAAENHARAVKAVDASRQAALESLKRNFVSSLAAAEMQASKRGEASKAAMLLKLRSSIQAGSEDRRPLNGMSAGQRRRQMGYFDSLDRIERSFDSRYKEADAAYLKELREIETPLPEDSELRDVIAGLRKKPGGSGDGAGRKLVAAYFDNTEWLWKGDPTQVWKFLPGGRIVTKNSVSGHLRWRITGTDTFVITEGGSDMWEFTMDFETMSVTGQRVTNPKNTATLAFWRRIPGR